MSENRNNYFFWNKVEFEEAVKRHVCGKCMDMGADGVCHTKDPNGCALLRYLPQLVILAQRLNDPKIESYNKAVRENICMSCRSQKKNDVCELRDTLNCGLDRYLPLVLEAIEEVDEALEERARNERYQSLGAA